MSRNARRKDLAPAPRPAAGAPRDPIARQPASPDARRYPSLAEITHGDLAAAVRAFARVAACVGLVGVTAVASGCETPQCSTGRLGELKAHGPDALSQLVDFYPLDAAKTLGVGIGIVPHPAPSAIAGEAVYVGPMPVPAPSTTSTP